jgi:hypothetical protein
MKKWVVVSLLLSGAVALAQRGPDKEAWIPLEDLSPEDQDKALDAEEKDRDKRDKAPEWSKVTDQLVVHALWNRALQETGADLTPGIR